MCFSFVATGLHAQANANGVYQALRSMGTAGATVSISNFDLARDAATFHFASGTFTFYGDVNGRTTGAVFHGSGTFSLTPPVPSEKHSLSLLTKEEKIDETFESAVFRFTDHTAAEIRKASTGSSAAPANAASEAQRAQNDFRHNLHWNIDSRILQDVLSTADDGGFFAAYIRGKKYSSQLLFVLDPNGARSVAPEEISLSTLSELKNGIWTAFHRSEEYKNGTVSSLEENEIYTIEHQDLDTRIEKNGYLSGVAKTTVIASRDNVSVIPMLLFRKLRVSKVTGPNGEILNWIQEGEDLDPAYAVILQKPLKRGERYIVTTTYAGKEAVIDEGHNNYYPNGGARESWYPNVPRGFGAFSTYSMRFHVPKNLQLIATGNLDKQGIEGSDQVTEWSSGVPIAVAGFSLGAFKHEQGKAGDIAITSYANEYLPDNFASLQQAASNSNGVALGTMSTTGMLKPELSQGSVALQIYTTYFGPLSFKTLSLTEQTACNYGQSWPMLIYLPICAFWDSTIQHELGILDGDPLYWKVVTAHEVAHQWWGHTVSFGSYRDQWMSEGFADFSASLFLQATRKDQADYREFWHVARDRITQKDSRGKRPNDIGPVILGYRLLNTATDDASYSKLVYPKGAYILHMLRMMSWSAKEGDAHFIQTMKDFVEQYRGKDATTEQFKAVWEKHMLPSMDLDGNGKLDWFFNEYVYGTELPTYSLTSSVQNQGGKSVLSFTITQSEVSDNFKMPVPVYVELEDKRVIRLGSLRLKGNNSSQQQIPITLPSPAKRIMINYNYDILALEK